MPKKKAQDLKHFTFQLKVWLYSGQAAWHFVTLPEVESNLLREVYAHEHRGWGSLPVSAQIGQTRWQTSIFFDQKRKGYLLPIKAMVRKKEKIGVDDVVSLHLEIELKS